MSTRPVVTSARIALSYLMGTCVVAALARGTRTIGQADLNSIWPIAFASLSVAAVAFGIGAADRSQRPCGLAEWAVAVLTALTNSLLLFSAALGIEKF